MVTLQCLLQQLDDTSGVDLWAVTATKHQYYFESAESQKFLKEDTQTAKRDPELFRCLIKDTPQIIQAIGTYLNKSRPAIQELAHELYNFIKKNEDYIAHELPELAAEVRCSSKNEIRTVMEKVLATLRPFREGAKEISKSWAGRKAGVEENMKLLAKGYSIDICSRMDSLQEKLQEDQRPRWNDMKGYLNKIQLDAKKATKEQNPLSDICKHFDSFERDWINVNSLCTSMLERTQGFDKKAGELSDAFKRFRAFIPPSPKINLKPPTLNAPLRDVGAGEVNLRRRIQNGGYPWTKGRRDQTLEITLPFDYPQSVPPIVITAIDKLSIRNTGSRGRIAFDVIAENATTHGVVVSFGTNKECSNITQDIRVKYLLISPDDSRLQTANEPFVISSSATSQKMVLRKSVVFKEQFACVPKVLCWLTGIDVIPNPERADTYHIGVSPSEISTKGFTLELETYISPEMQFLSATWVAFPRSVATGDDTLSGAIWGVSESTQPPVFDFLEPSPEHSEPVAKLWGWSAFSTKDIKDQTNFHLCATSDGAPLMRKDDANLSPIFKDAEVSLLQLFRTTTSSGKNSKDSVDPARALAALEEVYREETAKAASIKQQQSTEISKLKNDIDTLNREVAKLTRAYTICDDEREKLSSLASDIVRQSMEQKEREWVDSISARILYRSYRVGAALGAPGGKNVSWDYVDLVNSGAVYNWPTQIVINMVSWYDRVLVGYVATTYSNLKVSHGSEEKHHGVNKTRTITIPLADKEKVVEVELFCAKERNNYATGILYMKFITDQGHKFETGSRPSEAGYTLNEKPYDGMVGFKGFWGRSGWIVDRLGIVWGI